MRHVLAPDLKDDPALIETCEAHHREAWPKVQAHLARHGMRSMTIHRLGTRMVMVMTTVDAVFDAGRFARATAEDPVIARWEALTWTFQAPTPLTPAGDTWTPMRRIFDWSAASA